MCLGNACRREGAARMQRGKKGSLAPQGPHREDKSPKGLSLKTREAEFPEFNQWDLEPEALKSQLTQPWMSREGQ